MNSREGMDNDLTVDLKRSELFLGLDDEDLTKIVSLPSCHRQSFKANETIFNRGSESKNLYILCKGRVDLVAKRPFRTKEGQKRLIINVITKGDIFGWSSIVPPHVLTLSAVCKRPCEVIAINGGELNALLNKDISLGYKVIRGLVQIIGLRLRNMEQALMGKRRSPIFEDWNPAE